MTIIPALLKIKRNVAVLLSSFLLSAATIPIIDYAIGNVFRDSTKNLLATPYLQESLRLTKLLSPSTFNISFFIVIIIYLLTQLWLWKTKKGEEFRICGTAPEFAYYSGFNVNRNTLLGLMVSGMSHGLCGYFAVIGTYYTSHVGFYSGIGWNALTIALIAKNSPKLLLPASFLISYLLTASDSIVLTSNLNFDMTYIVQGVVLFLVTAQFLSNKIKTKNRVKREKDK